MAKQSAYLQRRDAQLDAVFWAGSAMAAQFAVDTLQMTMHQQEGWGYDRIMRVTHAWMETQREYRPALNCKDPVYAKNDMNCVKTAKEMDIHHNSVIYRLGKIKTETGLDARKFWDLVKLLEMEES